MTLYGQWSKELKLKFHKNSGSSSGNMPDLMLVAGETVDLPKCAYTPNAGYEFAGWNTVAKGTGKAYADGAKFTMPGKNTTLYAQWKGKKATITFNLNGGRGKMRKIQTHYGAKITLPKCAFTHGDNAFDCWTTNKDGSGKAYRDEAEITVDQISMSLYAQWKGLEAKVTFKPGGGKGKMAPITVTTPAALVLPDCAFTKKGYAFTGWMDGTKAVHAPGDKIRVTHDITLTAQWAKQGCIVFYKGNKNVQGEMADQYGLPGEKVRLAKNAFTLAGYEFTGWNTKKNGDGLDYRDGATVVIKDTKTLKLFAQWRKAEQGKLELTVYKTISKSKDLKLEAKVTLDGEPVKGAQVSFLFLGNTKTTKTSKKGVAKVLFSKSLMKNLEVGSKVQYSATCGDTTIKIKAKIVQ